MCEAFSVLYRIAVYSRSASLIHIELNQSMHDNCVFVYHIVHALRMLFAHNGVHKRKFKLNLINRII